MLMVILVMDWIFHVNGTMVMDWIFHVNGTMVMVWIFHVNSETGYGLDISC